MKAGIFAVFTALVMCCLLCVFVVLPAKESNAGKCRHIVEINTLISEAISIGAPTYNQGNHAGCYTIYEGASYKILYLYGDHCKETKQVLQEALEKASQDFTYTEKAWTLRRAFDFILGVPTQTK